MLRVFCIMGSKYWNLEMLLMLGRNYHAPPPIFFITDIQHVGISCKEMLTRLAERKVKYPILVISAVLGVYEDSGEPVWVQAVRCDWSPNLNVSFLSKPYTYKEFRTAFEAALKITAQRAP